MTRQCDCSGQCGPQSGDPSGQAGSELTRRQFMGVMGVTVAGAALSMSTATAGAADAVTQPTAPDLDRWKKALLDAGPARVYRSDVHTDARMHLGGIGTGNLEIGADGQLTTWQLFNTLRDGSVPLYFLARAGKATKLLQTRGGPDWPRVRQIEMTGEYPVATLRFRDTDLSVQVELTAFTPMAPLDTRLSSLPLAAFVFRIHNSTAQEQTVSLAALMQNPVGYDAAGRNEGVTHPHFGGNVNEVFRDSGATGLAMRAVAGREATIDKAATIYALSGFRGLKSPPLDRPKELQVGSGSTGRGGGQAFRPRHIR